MPQISGIVHPSFITNSSADSFMCSPIVWEWSEEKNRAFINMDVVHSCRKYDAIVDWAKARRLTGRFDYSVHAEE